MLLSDPTYLVFLVVVCLFLSVLPRVGWRCLCVVVASLYCYSGFLPRNLVFLGSVTLASYGGGLLLGRLERFGGARSWAFVVALAACLLPLVAFKYGVPVAGRLLPGVTPEALELPVGLSFYTFMAAGYLIDIYLFRISPQQNLLRYSAFLTFFPHLTAGPISRSKAVLDQLQNLGVFEQRRFYSGVRKILFGLFLKIVVADSLAPYVATVYAQPLQFQVADHLFATYLFSLQVYADFSGYSLIAIGSGQVLGIDLPENFRQPFLSRTLPEFWRTWHMTLSGWFRDYVFVPLQFQLRNSGAVGLALALILTFTLVGLWHGAAPQYALFGVMHGIMVSYSTLTIRARDEFSDFLHVPHWLRNGFRTVMTFCAVTLTFVVFRAETLSDAGYIYTGMATQWPGWPTVPVRMPLLISLLPFAGDVFVRRRGVWFDRQPHWVRFSAYHAVIACIVATGLYKSMAASVAAPPFIYFKF